LHALILPALVIFNLRFRDVTAGGFFLAAGFWWAFLKYAPEE